MSLLVVGLSHRSAPVEVLERVAASCADAGKVLHQLLERENVAEALLLSTCNRVEVYAVVAAFHDGLADITDVLAHQSAMTLDDLSAHLYVHYAAAGVEHLFSVAAGLDSMVVGEPQILGQLRTAYAGAEQAGAVGRTLHEAVQQALRVGKRVHTETGIDAAGASVVSEALAATAAALAGPDRTGLAGRRVLVLGAGSLGGLATAQLRRAGVAEIVLANRTPGSAQRLAALCEAEGTPARVVGLDGLTAALPTVDLVICCTGATGAVLSIEHVGARRRPLVVCDLGLPRNVDPAVGDVPGVTLLDLSTVARRLEGRGTSGAVDSAQHLVAQEVRSYLLAQRTAEVIPTVAALRKRAAEVVDVELLRLDGRLPGLDSAVRTELTRTVRRVVDKLLHAPTVRVKQLAEAGGGQVYADALRELFELDPQAAAAITAPVTDIGVGVFVSALREALVAGEVDAAVHSYKDLPTAADPRLALAAVPERADPRDALVARDGMMLGELPPGAVLGTGSPRRAAQLRGLGLGLQVVPIRGNVDSRIRRVIDGELDGVVVAAAGLARLGRIDEATELLDPEQMLPAPGQGALACECRVDDVGTEHALAAFLNDAGVRAAVTAERALLAALEAGCSAPVGALADVVEELGDDGRVVLRLSLRGVAATADDDMLRSYATGELTDAENLGRQVAAELLDPGASAQAQDMVDTWPRKHRGSCATVVGLDPTDRLGGGPR